MQFQEERESAVGRNHLESFIEYPAPCNPRQSKAVIHQAEFVLFPARGRERLQCIIFFPAWPNI